MATIRMIDIAVNFTDGMFKGLYHGKQCHVSDIATVLTRAWSSGVDRIIVTGGSLEESKEALAIAETDGRLFCTVGVHPTRCKEFEENGDPEKHYQDLLALAQEGIQKGKVVAIGECGLDYDRLHFCPAEIQKKYFEKQFDLASVTNLPMFLHMRAAADDFCEIVQRNKFRFTGGVTHSFTDSAEDRDKLLSFENMCIGINGCSLKTTENLDVVKGIPIERMMIETDSPYCEIKNTHAGIKFVKSTWPSKKKEKYDPDSIVKGRNEPCLVRQVLEVVAGCKGISDIEQLSKTLYHNTCSFGSKDSTGYEVKGLHKEVPQELIDELKSICKDDMTMDHDERYFHGKPQNSFHKAVNIPDVVVYPRCEGEVSKIVKLCDKYEVPIVPYGGATSIEGHTLSPHGGVCIDMTLMKKVKELHVEDMDVIVEPGIGWMELNKYLEPYGLFFPLDPGPGATIGGMCATRCSGSLAVRYGTMRDNVINLKVVLANGDVVRTASRARKSAAGYDLTRLVIGSEGTLGVITEVTLRLQKIPQHSVVAMCNFPAVKDAADVAIATMLSGIQVSRVELLDEVQVRAINIANGKKLPETPTLMFEFVGTEAYSREQTLIVQKIVSEHNGSDFVFAEDPEAKKELWKIRKEALWACFAMEPSFEAMITDVCVPLSHLAELISRSKEKLDASSLVCTVIAHAGDGNFHTVILFDPTKEEQRQEAERLNHFMVHTALEMEGTCTGEHGVGTGKMKYLEKELGVEALETMKRIKVALDPNNIMNPGKLIPPHICF